MARTIGARDEHENDPSDEQHRRGFWGTAGRNGYDQQMTWEAACDALATAFDLTPERVRDLLDARFGRLADDLV